MKIQNINIGKEYEPFIVAELSGNHNNSLEHALNLVRLASESGAKGLKLQTYTPDSMTLPINTGEFLVKDKSSLWEGQSLYDLYAKGSTPWEWHKQIFEYASELGMVAFSTPFDFNAVDFLETLSVPCYKISSFELVDIPLIEKVARTGKPVILSTGMGSLVEIAEATEALRDNGCSDFALLKCTSAYPASPDNFNINTLQHMRDLFNCEVGVSDHTIGVGVAIASVALGATVIEKHFTLKRDDGGIDSKFSIEPSELKSLVAETKVAWKALGKVSYGCTEEDEKSKIYRRSIYVTIDVHAGDVINNSNIRSIRPGLGIPPKYINYIFGRRFAYDIKCGTPFSWSMLA